MVSVGGIKTGVNYGVGCNGINLFADPTAAAAVFRPVLLSSDTVGGRGVLCGLPYRNLDASLVRRVTPTERVALLASVDAFNVLNHPNFYAPGLTYGSGSFGSINSMQVNQGRSTGARSARIGLRLEF
jgi:hypothetical protein